MKDHASSRPALWPSFASVLALASIPITTASPFPRSIDNDTTTHDWANVTPSADLTWTPCFDNYTCSRLIVPLDYSDPDIGTTTIAFMKLSSRNESAQDILINPGGPGGSGVQTVLAQGAFLSEMVGSQYNLVGFDPRGVNNSGPNLDCFPNAPEPKALFGPTLIRPFDSQNPDSLADSFALAGAYGDWCSRAHRNSSAKYANTPAVAADMLHYVEKRAVALGEVPEEAKLWYVGFSYGTILGATFASLFPDRVGRLVLDGVSNAKDYYGGGWGTNLIQSDEAVESFFTFCFEAGPEKCVFYAPSEAEIARRFNAIIADVRENPIPVTDPKFVAYPTTATYESLVFEILSALYSPLDAFPVLAQVMLDLEQRNGSSLAALTTVDALTADQPGALILCLDAAGRYNISTPEKWEQLVASMNNQSHYVADAWASIALICRNMDIYPPANQQFEGYPSANETSTPILFIGNTVDPVTPIQGAYTMSSVFGGSVVLTQNSVGHCSITSPSKCTIGYVQRYLADGSLPPKNTTCEVESVPFQGNGTAPLRM